MDDQIFLPERMTAYVFEDKPQPHDNALSHYLKGISLPACKMSPTKYLIRVSTLHISEYEYCYEQSATRTDGGKIPGHVVLGAVVATPTKDHWRSSGPKFKVGDEVVGYIELDQDGAAADYVLVEEKCLALKPPEQSALETLVFTTPLLIAWHVLISAKNALSDAGERGSRTVSLIAGPGHHPSQIALAIISANMHLVCEGVTSEEVPLDGSTNEVVSKFHLTTTSSVTQSKGPEIVFDLRPASTHLWEKIFSAPSGGGQTPTETTLQEIFDHLTIDKACHGLAAAASAIDVCHYLWLWNNSHPKILDSVIELGQPLEPHTNGSV